MMQKAYLIDAKRQRVTTIDIDTNRHDSIIEVIGGGCRLMEPVSYADNGDCLMVDEEGWVQQHYLFGWKGTVTAGNGVLVGPADADGYTQSVQTSELDCALAVQWVAPVGLKVSPELRDEILSEIAIMELVPATKPSKKKGEK